MANEAADSALTSAAADAIYSGRYVRVRAGAGREIDIYM
jgi:hypothetical protein